jgi:hypothetical protein
MKVRHGNEHDQDHWTCGGIPRQRPNQRLDCIQTITISQLGKFDKVAVSVNNQAAIKVMQNLACRLEQYLIH